jgi:hypothetical protein
MTRIMGTLHGDQYTFMIICRSIILRMSNVSRKSCRENKKTHFVLNNFFLKAFRLCDMWKNTVKTSRPQMAIWRMRIEWWMPKATNIHSEYVTIIYFPLQQWLQEQPRCYVIRTLPVL